MTRYVYHFIFIMVIAFSPANVCAQQKYEKESRLKQDQVPQEAIDLVDSVQTRNKVKWYLDEGLEMTTVEAKFFFNGQRHSVEFDTTGHLIDIEIEVPYKSLSEDVQTAISEHLSTYFKRHTIRKVQIQHSGAVAQVLHSVKTVEKTCTIRYELVVKGKKEDQMFLYEFLFDATGAFISVDQIILSNASNIEY
ncbi:MAG: hypothetical protein ACFHU9_05495 [Fluviicola sp.]